MGDLDLNASANSDDKLDSGLLKEILKEMKSEFNRSQLNVPEPIKYESNDSSTNEMSSVDANWLKENGDSFDSDEKDNVFEVLSESLVSHNDEASQAEDALKALVADVDDKNVGSDVSLVKDEESELATTLDSTMSEQINEDSEPPKRKSRVSKGVSKCKAAAEGPLPAENSTPVERKTQKLPELALKRSSRRTSKDFSIESVLQNAIALKEKSNSIVSKEKRSRRSKNSDDKNAKRHSSKASLKASSDDQQSLKGSNDSFRVTPSKIKSPNLNTSDDNESVDNGIQSSTPKKHVKQSLLNLGNGFDEECSNHLGNINPNENDWDQGIYFHFKFVLVL